MSNDDMLGQLISMAETAAVEKVFGEPRTVGNKTVISVAQVRYGLGAGFGEGTEEGATEDPRKPASGKGAGGGASIVPRGVIAITGDKVEVLPILDISKLAIAGMLLAAWNVFWVTLTVRSAIRRRRRDLAGKQP